MERGAMTLVCTVLPTFNERDNIAALIDGILANAMTPQLVLVVDDNSPDGTAAVVRACCDRYNTAEATHVALYVRTGQKGLTSAIQCGIDLALETFAADLITLSLIHI